MIDGLVISMLVWEGRLIATFDATGSHVEADCGVGAGGAVTCDGI